MSELHNALHQVSEIRAQVSRIETFRGYRSVTIGFSGILACVASVCQAMWLPDPATRLAFWLTLWIAVAAVSVSVIGGEMIWSLYRSGSRWRVRTTKAALEQMLPCLVAGVLVTVVLLQCHPQSATLLPGLWSILFSLGVFSSCRLLPPAVWWIAIWYLVAGCVVLTVCRGEYGFSPFAMAGTFGVGQLWTAAILHFSLERPRRIESDQR